MPLSLPWDISAMLRNWKTCISMLTQLLVERDNTRSLFHIWTGVTGLDWTTINLVQFLLFHKTFFFLFYHRFPKKIGHIFFPECNYINEISIDSVAIISCNYCPLRPILFVVYEKFIRLPSQFYSPARLMVSTFFASLPKSTVLSGWVTCLLVI